MSTDISYTELLQIRQALESAEAQIMQDRDRISKLAASQRQCLAMREVLEKIAELDGDCEGQKFKLTRFQASQLARLGLLDGPKDILAPKPTETKPSGTDAGGGL